MVVMFLTYALLPWRESLQSSLGRSCLKLLQVFAQGSRALLTSSKYSSQGLLMLLQMDTGVPSCLFVCFQSVLVFPRGRWLPCCNPYVTFEGEPQVSISGGIMETFFVRSSMNETPLDHWIAGKEAPIFPPTIRKEDSSPSGASTKCLAVIRQIKTVPGARLPGDGDTWPR